MKKGQSHLLSSATLAAEKDNGADDDEDGWDGDDDSDNGALNHYN